LLIGGILAQLLEGQWGYNLHFVHDRLHDQLGIPRRFWSLSYLIGNCKLEGAVVGGLSDTYSVACLLYMVTVYPLRYPSSPTSRYLNAIVAAKNLLCKAARDPVSQTSKKELVYVAKACAVLSVNWSCQGTSLHWPGPKFCFQQAPPEGAESDFAHLAVYEAPRDFSVYCNSGL
jgi:hypothetical protein